ncbi:hypothetical protein [Spirosoma sordidisoli]|uniref:Uncharacterized protein n=1 Tax=Spirosoma sordidisoli TaxID=2502893 RepID=A0A4Q2US92_9BACT|nr:hypothetical protein [Spirosoma sordidisoli]RYC70741.1 hypothetical protein EQG79_00885 [Spirosoma sordidisoli]
MEKTSYFDNFMDTAPALSGYKFGYCAVYMAILRLTRKQKTNVLSDEMDSIKNVAAVGKTFAHEAVIWLDANEFIRYTPTANGKIPATIHLILDSATRSTSGLVAVQQRSSSGLVAESRFPHVHAREGIGTHGHAEKDVTNYLDTFRVGYGVIEPTDYLPVKDALPSRPAAAVDFSGGRQFTPGHPPSDQERADLLAIQQSGRKFSLQSLLDDYENAHPLDYPPSMLVEFAEFYEKADDKQPSIQIWESLSNGQPDKALWLRRRLKSWWEKKQLSHYPTWKKGVGYPATPDDDYQETPLTFSTNNPYEFI